MVSSVLVLTKVVEEIKAEFPDFSIKNKADSSLMHIIDLLLKIITFGQMKRYMTDFITTVGNTVYVPTGWSSGEAWGKAEVLRHERVHMRQRRRLGSIRFSLTYLFWVLPAVFAIGRRNLEQEAYEESVRARVEYLGLDALSDQDYKEFIIGQFTTSNYFWMYPFRSKIEHWYDGVVAKIFLEKTRA